MIINCVSLFFQIKGFLYSASLKLQILICVSFLCPFFPQISSDSLVHSRFFGPSVIQPQPTSTNLLVEGGLGSTGSAVTTTSASGILDYDNRIYEEVRTNEGEFRIAAKRCFFGAGLIWD